MKYIFLLFCFYTGIANASDDFNVMNIGQFYESDQQDCTSDVSKIDWNKIIPKDTKRGNRVIELLKENQIITARDFWQAAIIMQHGQEISDIKIAYSVANI